MMTLNKEAVTQGPSWNLSTEYSGPLDPNIDVDLAALAQSLDDIEALNPLLAVQIQRGEVGMVEEAMPAIEAARRIHLLSEQAWPLLANPRTLAVCLLSVNSQDEAAQALQGALQAVQKRYNEALATLGQFLEIVSDEVIDEYLNHEDTRAAEFEVRHARVRRHELLGLAEENMAQALGQDGIHAWGRLYDQLSGTLQCTVLVGNETRLMGLAEAGNLMQEPDDAMRRAAWSGINAAWAQHEESCAAAINAIAGWRLEMTRRRSHRRPVHFLDAPTHMNKLQKSTLEALFDATRAARPLSQRAARAMGRMYGKETIGPWDMRAPASILPGNKSSHTTFDDAIDIIADAYGTQHADMGDFVHMMAREGWIEGTVGPNKRPGAFCTGFAKSRTPRVYMTYSGSSTDVITLAHELGHAFHSWVMRDLPLAQCQYGMALAETASTFGETIVRDKLLDRAATPGERLDIVWEEMSALTGFLLNIPARFEFERRFYEAREQRPLRPKELQNLMSEAWVEWYGDAISEPDPMFWANKLHFYIAGLSFY
ncbi:MAG: peptidase family M3, partial [Chromatiales bacterium]|nr:peptidase family M3 [Chromatiales bacterium]